MDVAVKLLAFTVSAVALSHCCELKYSELQKLGASCSPEDTCSLKREFESLTSHRCLCQARCIRSRTCCIDSPHVRVSQKGFRLRGTCQNIAEELIVAVSHCDPRWRGDPQIRAMCENPSLLMRDPVSIMPVTNLQTGATYSNYFCAYCNNEAQFSSPWLIELETNANYDQDVILESMFFNETMGGWGVIGRNLDGTEEFQRIFITFQPRREIVDLLVPCVTNVVSDCDPRWEDNTIRTMCRSYMGMVYLNPDPLDNPYSLTTYRNVHCAICNYIQYNSTNICTKFIGTPFASKPPMSLALLLDVNLSDGDKVGYVQRCGDGEMYDSFFKKCRTLRCILPSYIRQGNKCVKV